MSGGRIGDRRTALVVALTMLALALPAGVLAKSPFNKPTRVKFTYFIITSSTGIDHRAEAGTTFTHCASEIETILDAHGTLARTVEDQVHRNIWSLNGVKRNVFRLVWTQTKRRKRPFFTGIQSNEAGGLPDGRWTLKIVQKGRKIGPPASVTLAENPAC
jgi:hypothetical protein